MYLVNDFVMFKVILMYRGRRQEEVSVKVKVVNRCLSTVNLQVFDTG